MSRTIKYPLSIIILLCCGLSLYAQQMSASQTLVEVETYYKSLKAFDVEVEYSMYKGYTGNHITESYKGTIYKNEAVSQIKILGSEIIQFPEIQITINKENKTLVYRNVTENVMKKSPMDVSTFLKFYKEVNTKTTGNSLIYDMELIKTEMPIPYNKVKIFINKNTYELEKQVLYFATKVPFVDENGKETPDVGRLEISFKQNTRAIKKAPKLSDYLVLEANNKVRLAQGYATYTIVNQTNL